MLDKLWDAKTGRVLFTALVFLLVLAFLHAARGTLTLFLFAILFSYFLEPLVSRLEPRVRGRIAAISVVYFCLIAIFLVLGMVLGPRIANEARSLFVAVPHLLDQLASGEFLLHIGRLDGLGPDRQHQVQQFFMAHKPAILDYAKRALTGLERPASRLWWLILIPILGFFFLKDAPAIAVGIVDLGSSHGEKGVLAGIVSDVNVMLGSYVRAQILLALLTTVVLTVVLALMRVPYAFLLGPLAGLCEFVPVVGPAVASAVIFGLGILLGYPHLLWLFLWLGTWRVIQDYISAPRIMGKSLEISPLAEIFAVLAGGEIGGVIGALVAVPIVAILRILYRRLIVVSGASTAEPPVLRASQLPDAHKA